MSGYVNFSARFTVMNCRVTRAVSPGDFCVLSANRGGGRWNHQNRDFADARSGFHPSFDARAPP
jgi:hypothetical protein